jgi:hypothetical protein
MHVHLVLLTKYRSDVLSARAIEDHKALLPRYAAISVPN